MHTTRIEDCMSLKEIKEEALELRDLRMQKDSLNSQLKEINE